MALKPNNYAVREALSRLMATAISGPYPEVDETLVAHLEALYPPQCYTGDGESLEAHLLYAGKVQLIVELRNVLEKQSEEEAVAAEITALELDIPGDE